MKIRTKYNGLIDLELYQDYCVKSIFKILPLMEERKNWRKFLEGFLLELSGINSLSSDISYISLIGKLQGLLIMEIDYEDKEQKDFFKKIIFDSIDLVKKLQPTKEVG